MKPREDQIAFLRAWHIEPLPSENACRRLIAFLQYSNRLAKGTTIQQRVALYQKAANEWTGKRVRDNPRCVTSDRVGEVRFITARTITEIATHDYVARWGDSKEWTSPFKAMVKWDNARVPCLTSLYYLELIPELTE